MRLSRIIASAMLLAMVMACSRGAGVSKRPPHAAGPMGARAPERTGARRATSTQAQERYCWQPEIRSPRFGPAPPQHALLQQHCGRADVALERVAVRIAKRQARGDPPLDMPEISFALRAEGSSYVWARAWTVEGVGLADEETLARLQRWLESFSDGGERRCGVAKATARDGASVVAVLVVDAVADLEPIATRARLGQWIRLRAAMLVPTQQAQVVILGPRGAPRTAPTTVSGSSVRANFSVDQVGPWTIQVLATLSGGPRPVAEALVHVDRPPPEAFQSERAPGEHLAAQAPDERAALLRMINAVRRSEGLAAVRSDPRLQAVAQAHAEAMRDAGRLGHDVGNGGPESRVQSAQLPLRTAGENVAHAASVERAHRALWSSPSHRGNLLYPRFGWVGIGVALDAGGNVWVCQVFADL